MPSIYSFGIKCRCYEPVELLRITSTQLHADVFDFLSECLYFPTLQPFFVVIYYKLFKLATNALTISRDLVKILLERMKVNILAEPRTELSEIMAVFIVFNTLEYHQARDTEEDLSLAAFDLFFEIWVLRSKFLHMFTERNYLFPI